MSERKGDGRNRGGRPKRLTLAELMAGIHEAFAFLCEEYGYVFSTARERSVYHEVILNVLRWENARHGRALEVWLTPLAKNYTYHFACFVRHQNGARPSFKDNINFLALDRVLALWHRRPGAAHDQPRAPEELSVLCAGAARAR